MSKSKVSLYWKKGFRNARDAYKLIAENPVKPNESLAVAFANPKTTSLFYDRVWTLNPLKTPKEIGFFYNSKFERFTLAFFQTAQLGEKSFDKSIYRQSAADLASRWEELGRIIVSRLGKTSVESIFHELEPLFYLKYIRPTAVFPSSITRDWVYKVGDYPSLVTLIQNIDIVDESALNWEQILEFRNDKEAQRNYREFIHWLDAKMVGKSERYIKDEIVIKLEKYHAALKKHGIKTVIGILAGTFDLKAISTGTIATAGTSLVFGSKIGALIGLSVMIGKTAIKIVENLLNLDDIKRGSNSEIAFVYEMRRKF